MSVLRRLRVRHGSSCGRARLRVRHGGSSGKCHGGHMSSQHKPKAQSVEPARFHPLISKSGCQDSQSHKFCVSRVPVGPQRGALYLDFSTFSSRSERGPPHKWHIHGYNVGILYVCACGAESQLCRLCLRLYGEGFEEWAPRWWLFLKVFFQDYKLVLRIDCLVAEKGENPKGPTRKDPKVSGRAL